ncbi:Uncharacterised protein [Candidatus Tiddalikarchaeum anstoanum]|nr:Uncharacterised protein [Candidatus Tiddalikarchaeum anstoanum]
MGADGLGKNRTEIILDTNILFVPIRDKFDIFSEIRYNYPNSELVVLKESLNELEKLEKNGITEAVMAKENVLKLGIKIIDVIGEKDVDSKILSYAKKQNAFIVTGDKILRERAKKEGLTCLAFYKSRKKIVVT